MNILFIAILLIAGIANADTLKYNYFENKWVYADEDAYLRLNPYENRFEFATDEEELRLNYMDLGEGFQYAKPERIYQEMLEEEDLDWDQGQEWEEDSPW